MTDRPLAAIILAAGQGTRMKSDTHKVLHPIAGKPMLHHLLDTVDSIGVERTVIVVGARREQIEKSVEGRDFAIAVQEDQLGTGHAVAQAHEALRGFAGDVLILYGDVPMVSADTMRDMVFRLNNGTDPRAVVLGFRPDDAGAYGRIIADDQGEIEKMVEFKDASDAERGVDLCNSGLMAARSTDLFILLDQISNDNAAGEYYLPDIVMLPGQKSAVIEVADPAEVAGVNSRAELAAVERQWQQRRRAQAMADGVSLIAPETVWFSSDTKIAADVVVEPNVIFGPGVSIASGTTIYGHSHIEGAQIAANANVGPFARLRPGSVMEEGSKIGNFVEMKKTTLGKGAKANHLTYLGDAEVGEGANIGAGTITCNYDGYFKYKTVIGKGAFIGSNSALVAPVVVGDGAIVGAGAALTKDVAAGDLALVRAEQTVKAGWATKFRDTMLKKKAAKKKS
ncbi:MAG: bifunctional UDP-N-acetylglucosamine diphosphorylase/glucosamine-1-phosphate N-acetyltransferase GlmU [Sphingomonadales bacterium]|nr:bifunctional UDP-N-acetylglucosamine diphosphorylase/glucosamine-1-phosphate N-acetyltransferase GlmU [Sphingomonadales bacterium]PIX65210.1 MAG: bifunctional N-acetylglucosamine-1-phosphate uridyltransferase/glucosamine-1-phosphate acetyltransferase [Sphingomonadales bacterium CG_4_10_14_3_um_filter_58_15]NCO49204.1 bifunctional UDP-N-acetylglucosamine diphosphorylase/glucosamine-1-phosphate N-acetyltransferase GlmU [Sphingomonadales bacterium]NCP00172.1 bifunctional UDP-N-acetylglucosamine 